MDASLDEGEASKHITFLAAAVPVGGHIHVRLGLGRAVGLGYVEGRRGARGGVVPRDGEGDAVLGCRGGVDVAGFCRDVDRLGRVVGLGSEGWGGGAGGCCSAVLYGICCRICVGAVFSFGCVAARGVGLRLLPGCCPRLHGFCDGCHGQRRAGHGRARDRAEQVVKGRFIAEPLGEQPIGSEGGSRTALRAYFVGDYFTGTPVNISELSGECWGGGAGAVSLWSPAAL